MLPPAALGRQRNDVGGEPIAAVFEQRSLADERLADAVVPVPEIGDDGQEIRIEARILADGSRPCMLHLADISDTETARVVRQQLLERQATVRQHAADFVCDVGVLDAQAVEQGEIAVRLNAAIRVWTRPNLNELLGSLSVNRLQQALKIRDGRMPEGTVPTRASRGR